MNDVFRELGEALAEELRLVDRFREAAVEKREALGALEVRRTEIAAARERQALADLGPAAARRIRRTAEAARLLGGSGDAVSLESVAHRAPEPWASALQAHASRLREAIADALRINARVRELSERPLAALRRLLVLRGSVLGDLTYTPRGVRAGGLRTTFDEVV